MDAPLCHYCHRPLDRQRDEVVAFDVESDRYDTPQFVAHRDCRVRWLREEADRLSERRSS
jgi:hypothetical protein